jgi:hypothetical protein
MLLTIVVAALVASGSTGTSESSGFPGRLHAT